MPTMRRLAAISLLAAAIFAALAPGAASAASHAHVYLFRGLADIFSTGMDTLADEINKRGVYATSHSHTDWKALADQAAIEYKAGKEGPIILVGHSLGADAVMEMADYLGDKGVPVALVMPFDGTQSFPASANIGRVVNFTQRDYAYMRKGPGFRGTLVNVDLSSDPNIGHLNIDKSARLHARAITEILAVAAGHMGLPVADKPGGASPAPSVTIGNVRRDENMRREDTGSGEHSIEREVPVSPLVPPARPVPQAPASRAPQAEEAIVPIKPETSAPPPANIPLQAPAAPVSPVFPPQPPPPRLVPVKPMEIPD
jgi:Thioesterase domain